MEAATPLRKAQVRTIGDRLVIEDLVVEDQSAVQLVREREEAGEDAAAVVTDAIEIGARVLDREQAGANAEFVRTEFDKTSREVEAAFTEKAGQVGEELKNMLEEVFGPDSGHLARALERHFSDESSTAVQHRVRELVAEVMTKSREDLLKQFSSADGQNPLADFKAGTLTALKRAGEQQDANLRALLEKMGQLEKELQGLRDEREKLEEIAAERERGTAKGRDFEEEVAEAIDSIARARDDDSDPVGDVKGAKGRTGDIVVSIDACKGPPRGRIVFEAKNSRMSKPKALEELDEAMDERDADFAVLVVPTEEKVPARMHSLREYNGDKMIVTWDPESDSPLALEVAYSLARARVLMVRGEADGIDAAAIRDTAERALDAMGDVRRIKSQLTGATTSIEKAEDILETMSKLVRDHLEQIAGLLAAEKQLELD
jgi:hypothetical protein